MECAEFAEVHERHRCPPGICVCVCTLRQMYGIHTELEYIAPKMLSNQFKCTHEHRSSLFTIHLYAVDTHLNNTRYIYSVQHGTDQRSHHRQHRDRVTRLRPMLNELEFGVQGGRSDDGCWVLVGRFGFIMDYSASGGKKRPERATVRICLCVCMCGMKIACSQPLH